MTRPRAPKNKSRGGGGTPTAAQAAAAAEQGAAAQQQYLLQQQQIQQQQPQQQQAAAKKRPAGDGGGAAAAVGEQPEVDQLEHKRMAVAEELRAVEKQIFDLETNYFLLSAAMGNAIRGYEGFLGPSKKAAPPVQPDERLFSWSSVTGQVGIGGGAPGE